MSMNRPVSRNAGEHGAEGTDGQQPPGDALAARVWREHRGWVAAVIRANMPRGTDADDLLQEVAMKLVQHIDAIDSPDRIGPWLRTVAINLARSAGRRHVRTQRIFQPFDEREPEADGTDRADAAARGRVALSIAESLPPLYREPLLLSLRGLSYKQIGLVLDLPRSTIETRLSRARAMVREELQQADERDEAPAERSPENVKSSFSLYGKASTVADEKCHE